MNKRLLVGTFVILLCSPLSVLLADEQWTDDQQLVLDSIERLSTSTAPGGAGADEYAAILTDDYDRWTTGSSLINGKVEWVEGVRSWIDAGWRVADRKEKIIQIKVVGDHALVRRIVEETYHGPDGERTISKAALAESWTRVDGGWLLSWVNADVLEIP